MAQVHRAKKRGPAGVERSVALKRMISHLAEDSSFVDSFIREAKVVSLLVHPNIAQVYDFGRIGGIYYIAMELVPGFDLRKLLRYANRANEPIPLPVVLSILIELCEALEYAHTCRDESGARLNIVHRDISPSNMIIAASGHLKVIDFGIAKASARQLHTESGQVKGKLGYMSPESALGQSAGAVSDVFSMGVVAWELVTASPLFSARTDFETMRKIREAEVVPPSRHNPSCPPELDRLIMFALERDPEHRLGSAGAFRHGLEQIAAKYGIHGSRRAVAEWMSQFLQPEDYVARSSGRTPPPESATAILSSNARLDRSPDEIALATEIWGEDAETIAPPPAGPDFSVDIAGGAKVPTIKGLALANAAEVRFSPGTAPAIAELQLTAPGKRRASPLPQGPPAPEPPPPAPEHAPDDELGGSDVADGTPTDTHKRARPKHHGTASKHVAVAPPVDAAVAVAPPPPAPKPDAADVKVVKPEPPAVPEPPKTPQRTPAVSGSSMQKVSGDLPTIRGDTDGDALVKMCIDTAGAVTSVKVVQATAQVPPDLTHALAGWRYKPYVGKDGKPEAVCFALKLRVEVNSSD